MTGPRAFCEVRLGSAEGVFPGQIEFFAKIRSFADVAQLVEQLIRNQ